MWNNSQLYMDPLLSDGISAVLGNDTQTYTTTAAFNRGSGLGPDTTKMVGYFAGGGPRSSHANFMEHLDPAYDFDFSDVQDDGKRYTRGGFEYEYKRPYGWKRYATKVVGKYEDDEWLGPNGLRTDSYPGEWPVSYHGTNASSARKILMSHFKAGPRELFGHGIYTSPCLEMVGEEYAKEYIHMGKRYKMVLQTRVNPENLKIIPASKTGKGAEYWLSPESEYKVNVRLYGILIREVKPTAMSNLMTNPMNNPMTNQPYWQPYVQPYWQPFVQPYWQPFVQPYWQPFVQPHCQPSGQPNPQWVLVR